MIQLDRALKIVWLTIGVVVIVWLGMVRVPNEWSRWQQRRVRDNRPLPVRQEPGVIVGEKAARDRAASVVRQGLRFSGILDPALKSAYGGDITRPLKGGDWLLIPVGLSTYSKPKVPPPAMLREVDPRANYTWKSGLIGGDYRIIQLRAVNVVFYRRDGRDERLLLNRPAWVQAVLLPQTPDSPYYYELAVSDTNGDGRIDQTDAITLWTSGSDGSDLRLVWMPDGRVEPKRYREPMSGDLFGTVVDDTDGDGEITEYDRHELFRVAIGDTSARAVVSKSTIAEIEDIVYGEQ